MRRKQWLECVGSSGWNASESPAGIDQNRRLLCVGTRSQATSRGARLYAAECASCHGARLKGQAMPTRPDARLTWMVPPIGMTGHAWQHSDAELAGIVAHGTKSVAPPSAMPGMPAFAERLDPGEIDAVLAYVKSCWTGRVRAYQATLPGGGLAMAALMRDPAWTFPAQCPFPPAATDSP